VIDYIEVLAPAAASASSACPDDTHITGGGFLAIPASGSAHAIQPIDSADANSDPDDGFSASVQFAGNAYVGLYTYGLCSEARIRYPTVTAPAQQHSVSKATARCPGSTHVTGGGGSVSGAVASAFINSSYPVDGGDGDRLPDDGWRVRVYNSGDFAQTLTVAALCRRRPVSYSAAKTTLGPGVQASVKPKCAQGSHVLGGGGELNRLVTEGRLRAVYPNDTGDPDKVPDDGFVITGENQIAVSTYKRLTGYAICG
jgi:hypothetical protein